MGPTTPSDTKSVIDLLAHGGTAQKHRMAHTAHGTYFSSLDAQMTHTEYDRMQQEMYGSHFA